MNVSDFLQVIDASRLNSATGRRAGMAPGSSSSNPRERIRKKVQVSTDGDSDLQVDSQFLRHSQSGKADADVSADDASGQSSGSDDSDGKQPCLYATQTNMLSSTLDLCKTLVAVVLFRQANADLTLHVDSTLDCHCHKHPIS